MSANEDAAAPRTPMGDPVAPFDPMMGQLETIEPGLAMFHGFANVAFAYGGGEMMCADTSSPQTGAIAIDAIRKITDEPFAFIIYTHGHGDHAFGTQAFIKDALARGYQPPKIWAHENVIARFDRYAATRGWQAHINSRQFAINIPTSGLFSARSFSPPNLTFRDYQLLELAKEPVEIRHAMGETDDASWIWMPRRRVAMVGDLIVWSMPNTGNPNKVQRYTIEWAEALEAIASRKPRVVLPGHGPAIVGEDACAEVLSDTAGALRLIHDEVIRRLNAGQWPIDIVEADIQLPPELASKRHLQPIYGCVTFVVRDVIRRYAGWWSGEPSQMFPATRAKVGADIVALCGRNAMLKRAQDLRDQGELSRALAIAEIAFNADGSDREAIALNADILERMAAGERSFIARNFFLASARELRVRLK